MGTGVQQAIGAEPQFVQSRSVEVSGTLNRTTVNVVIQQGLPAARNEPFVLELRSDGMTSIDAGDDGCAFEVSRDQLEILAGAILRAVEQARAGGMLAREESGAGMMAAS